MIHKKAAILSLILSIAVLFSSCASPSAHFEDKLSFDLYKTQYADNILSLIENRATEEGIFRYSSMRTDINATFYALKIFKLLDASAIPVKNETIEYKISETLIQLDKNRDLFTLDRLWYLMNIYFLIEDSNTFPADLKQKVVCTLKEYSQTVLKYDEEIADIYRITMMQDMLDTLILDKQKVAAFSDKQISLLNEKTILKGYPVLYIANANKIDISDNTMKNIFHLANTKMHEMYTEVSMTFPDLYQNFELLCYLDPNYDFNRAQMLKLIEKWESDSGLYAISEGNSENPLPTYWGLLIQKKCGVTIERRDEIISRLKQIQNLDGFFYFVNEAYIDPQESYAASVIYKMLEGEKKVFKNQPVDIHEMSPRARYNYSVSAAAYKSTKPVENFIADMNISAGKYMKKVEFARLFAETYMYYCEVMALKNLQQPIDREVQQGLLKFIEDGFNKSDLEKLDEFYTFIYLTIESLLRKEVEDGYLISENTINAISIFLNSDYKNDKFKNDTLFCLYMCVKLMENEPAHLEKYSEESLRILNGLLLDDGLFCLGIANKEANYDSTLMGLEILNILRQ